MIAVGACAISGGPYIDHREIHNGADSAVPVDLYVPGCPPHPYTILEGLLGLLGRARSREERSRRIAETAEAIRKKNVEAGIARADQAVHYLGADLGKGPPVAKPDGK